MTNPSDALADSFAQLSLPPARVRPLLSGASAPADPGFGAFLRAGQMHEAKALSGADGASGGYAVPEQIDMVIDAALKAVSPIRQIASVVRVGSSGYRKLVTTGGAVSGWAAEDEARPLSDTPVFAEIVPPMGDLWANPSATQAMLDDAQFDVEAWLAGEIAADFARAEGAAFVNGSGVNRPRGFLQVPTSAARDAVRPFGTLQHIATGAAGAFGANPADQLIDLVHALAGPYRQGAVWVMNAATLARIRKLKTADGAFLWTPGIAAGAPATLLGYPVVEAEDMPDIAANALAIAFGNFARGYLIAERAETQILRDPFSNKPFVSFYASKRVGGCVSDSQAIKLMKFAAN
ncbi:phage major capsid protein [Sphingomonas sp.]|uniref:phage major capsid protein n=1 Tax=Sphingomonas sp. TaxID=28214 RepID=UPI001D658157|nr:phage major capsid protein [Sphingomonas sp.]MBX9796007.1 phage major capsid protein [Sphingomonas sp.]